MPEFEAEVRLADDDEAERFARLRPADRAGPQWLEAGARTARNVVVPAMMAGHYGLPGREMDRNIQTVFRQTMKLTDGLNPDDVFMWRLGWEAVVLPAKEAALMAVGIGAGLALAATASDVLAAALTQSSQPAGRSATGSALSMPATASRRPLRPEDFGALPPMRAGPATRPGFDAIATRTAASPSPGVGPIHGSGEPPLGHTPSQ